MHQVDARQEFVRRIDAVQVLAGNAHELRQARAGADEHRVVAFFFHQFVDGDGASHDDVGFKHDAHGAHVIDLLANDLLRQAELGNAIHQHAADLVQRFENVNLVSLLDQIARRGQARRAAADDGYLLSLSAALWARCFHVEVRCS
jgi:hypothetical protein